MAEIRILIADDHFFLRQGLRNILEGEEGMAVIGEARNGSQAEEKAVKLQPDVILLDLDLPEEGGIPFAHFVKKQMPSCAVLILTVEADKGRLLEAVRAGAEGYVLTDADRQTLVDAIRGVCDGERACSENVAKMIFEMDGVLAAERDTLSLGLGRDRGKEAQQRDGEMGSGSDRPGADRPSQGGQLTAREMDVLWSMAQGHSNNEIAQDLYISEKTVKNHATRIFRKLGASNRAEAVKLARRRGLLEPPAGSV